MVGALILFLVLPPDLIATVVSKWLGIYSDIIEIRLGLVQGDFFEIEGGADHFSRISISGVGL
jgi:methyl coenzyme M reductase beta subunit